jgi:predicted metal-dependent peptidase
MSSTREIDKRLKELIAKWVLKDDYWGFLFSRIRRKPSKHIPSIMGIGAEYDGTLSLLYKPELVEGTADDQIHLIIEHEGMHVLNKHLVRTLKIIADTPGGIKAFNLSGKSQILNIAQDCAINQQMKFPDSVTVAGKPWPACHPKKYDMPDNKSADWYYQELLKKAKKVNVNFSGGEGFDDHKGWGEGEGMQGVADVNGLARKIDNHIGDIVKESLKNFNKERGSLPGHIAELIEQALAAPTVPYYQIIRRLVRGTRLSKFKRSFTRINRKRTYTFVIGNEECIPEISPFPGRTRDFTFFIVILIDTSGSQSTDDIIEALAGVKTMIENDKHCRCVVLENDTQVQKEYDVKKLRDIEFNVKGRGGTILQPGLERARQLGCDICLTFTDGYTDAVNQLPRKMLPKKTVFVIGERNSSDKALRGAGPIVRWPNG